MIIFTVLGVLMVIAAAYIFIPRAAFIVCVATIIMPKLSISDVSIIVGLILVVFAAVIVGLFIDIKYLKFEF